MLQYSAHLGKILPIVILAQHVPQLLQWSAESCLSHFGILIQLSRFSLSLDFLQGDDETLFIRGRTHSNRFTLDNSTVAEGTLVDQVVAFLKE